MTYETFSKMVLAELADGYLGSDNYPVEAFLDMVEPEEECLVADRLKAMQMEGKIRLVRIADRSRFSPELMERSDRAFQTEGGTVGSICLA